MSTSSLRWSELVEKLNSGLDLERDEIQSAMQEILGGESDIEDVKSFLLALKAKGETSDEVGALVEVMYAHAGPITISERAVDTVGTGGDGAHTINISTTAAIIAAAAGARQAAQGHARHPAPHPPHPRWTDGASGGDPPGGHRGSPRSPP